jgi:hypothetical protein
LYLRGLAGLGVDLPLFSVCEGGKDRIANELALGLSSALQQSIEASAIDARQSSGDRVGSAAVWR